MAWTERIFGSPTRVALLRALADHADHAVGVRELGRLAGVSPIQTSRLVRDFLDLGILTRPEARREGQGEGQRGGQRHRGSRELVRVDLGHPVMRELVLPLLAFEDRELERAAAAMAARLARAGMTCRAVLSTTGPDGAPRLMAAVDGEDEARRAAGVLGGSAAESVLAPAVEVLSLDALRGRSRGSQRIQGTLRRRWGATVTELLEDGKMIATYPRALRHDFAQGLDGWVLHDPLAQRARWLGRDALLLGGGGVVLAPVAAEPPYTLRATVSGGPGECYVGFCFHLADAETFESVYLAPQGGSDPQAVQYDPVINGAHTWQIFGDADGLGDSEALARAPLRRERWHRLRLDVWPEVARVYVEDEEPLAGPVPRCLGTFALRTGRTGGRVGLWGYLPSYVADFELVALEDLAPPVPAPKVVTPAGMVREWLIARYDADARRFTDVQPASAEHNGVLCLNRAFRFEPGARAYAACEVDVPDRRGSIQPLLELGYSDRARVWWDGALVHEGEWRWDSVARMDGRVRPGHVTVPLPAAPGKHHLLVEMALVEPPFGWGLAARVTLGGVPCASVAAQRLEIPRDVSLT